MVARKRLTPRGLRWRPELHLHRLRNVKPAIDNKPPPRRPHLKQALKRRQMEEGAGSGTASATPLLTAPRR